MEREISNSWNTELSFFLRRAPRTFVVLPETLNNIKEKLLFPPLQEPSIQKYVNEDSPNIKDFNTNFASLQSWFIHSSHQTKVQFILKLVTLFLKEHNADLLLEFIELSGTSKDLLYGRSQYTHTVQDKTPLDDNRSNTLGAMLFEAQSISFMWFSALAEREQALVIITLSSMGGASLSYTIVREALKIIEEKRRQSKGKARHCLFGTGSDLDHHLEAGRRKSTFKGRRKSVKSETGSMYKSLNAESVLAKKEAEWQEMYSHLLEQSGFITKRHAKSQTNKDEPIDSLQLMPISVNRVIYSYLDAKSKTNLRSINKYWKTMGQEIQKEENIRQWLNKIIRKMQIKGTAFKGRSWGNFNNKTDSRKLCDSVSFENIPRLRSDVSEARAFSGLSNTFSAGRTEDADIPQKIKKTRSEPNMKITKFEMKTRSDFEVTLKRKPSMKFPYVGKYTVIKISERYDHERVVAANKHWIAISDGCNITLHSFLTGAPLIARLQGHTACVTALAFHPSRSRIFSGSYDTTVRYWDVYSRTLIHEFCGHQSVITSVSANELFLCSASMDQTIKVFDVTSGAITWSYECVTAPTVVAIDKRQTLYAGSFTGHVEKIFLSYDEDFKKSDVCPSEDLPPVTTEDDRLGLNIELPKDDAASLKSDCKSIKTAMSKLSSSSIGMDDGEEGAEEGIGEEMSQGSRNSSNRIRFAHSGEVTSIFVEPPLILTSGVDGVVHVWHCEYFDDGLLMTLHHKGRRVNSVAVSYLLILTASEDGRLRIWDIETKSLKREIVVNTNRRPIISMVCLEMFDHSKIVLNNEDGIKVLEFPFDWIKLRKLCIDKKNIRPPPKQLTRNLTASPSDVFSKSQFKKLPVKNTYSEKRARDLEVRWSTLRDVQGISPRHVVDKGIRPVLQATPAPEHMLQFDRLLAPPVQELDILKVKVDEKPESKHCLFRSRTKQDMNHIGRRLLRKLNQHRCFHTTEVKLIDPRSVEEVKIPVPWGHIAGKWWGNKTQSPIIALHGALDNANSFDRLMPHLDVPGVLCIDLPGHGHSSNLPAGMLIKYPDYIMGLRYLLKHCLNWNNVTFIAHSFGSTVCYSYAAIFPNDVHSMVNIDCSRMMTAAEVKKTCTDLLGTVEASLHDGFEFQSNGYSWDETIKHMYKVRSLAKMPLSMSSCEIICERGTKKIGNNYVFSFDSRLKYRSTARFTKSEYLIMAKQICCEVLNITASRGLFSIKNNVFWGLAKIIPEEFDLQLKELEKSSKRFRNVLVEGSHHVHLEEPQKVSCIINDFLKQLL